MALYLFYHFAPALHDALAARMGERATEDSIIRIPKLVLWSILAFLGVRALSTIIFDFLFRIRRGYEAPTLVRNIFSLLAFTGLFVLIFNKIYQEVNLGALFTTSAIFGVIIGLALQDTLGNFFAGISLHADPAVALVRAAHRQQQHRLQHSARLPGSRGARRVPAAAGLRNAGRAARDPSHRVSRTGGRAGSARGVGHAA